MPYGWGLHAVQLGMLQVSCSIAAGGACAERHAICCSSHAVRARSRCGMCKCRLVWVFMNRYYEERARGVKMDFDARYAYNRGLHAMFLAWMLVFFSEVLVRSIYSMHLYSMLYYMRVACSVEHVNLQCRAQEGCQNAVLVRCVSVALQAAGTAGAMHASMPAVVAWWPVEPRAWRACTCERCRCVVPRAEDGAGQWRRR